MHFIGLDASTQCGIHALMALNQPLAFKLQRDDDRAPMPAIAIDLKVLAIEPRRDDSLKFRSLLINFIREFCSQF